MSKEIFNIDDINKDSLIFNNIRESRGGSYIAEINNLKYIYLTKHIAKEGLSFNNKSCYVDLELTNNIFFNFLKDFDTFFKKAIFENSNDWFSYNLSEKQIDDFYVSLINYRKKFNKDPYLRLKIPISKQTISANICDDNNVEIDIDRLPIDELILSGIIEIKGLKFLKQEVICEMELVSIIVHNAKPKLHITNLIKKNKKSTDETSKKSIKKEISQKEKEEMERREKEEMERREKEEMERREKIEMERREKIEMERGEKQEMERQKRREEQDEIDSRSIYSKTYSEYNRIEESHDKIIKDELVNRLEREKISAQKIFKEAHNIMELYEKKREDALRQAEIVKELEFELSNLE